MSAYKLPGSLYICVCVFVCGRMILHFHIVNTFRAYASCRICIEPFIMIWSVVVELLILRTQQIKPSKLFIFSCLLTFILLVMAVTMSENCHVLCSIV